MLFDKTILVRGLMMAFGGSVALLSAQLHAQDAGTPAGTTATDTQRVIVTGSNIRRTDAETPAPVQVITAEEIKASGYTSIQDVLHGITANGQGTLSQGFSGAFASGASGISLRGLNTSATLVLIDGHRSAPYPIGDDGQRSFVDIANIPFDAVERIEVLKDGASAIYGSDAIAGVVNIILKRSYTGGKISADVGTSYKNDGSTRHASGIYGLGDLDKDGYNAFFSGELRKQDQIRYSDRGHQFTKTDFTSQGGYNVTPGVPNAGNGGLPASSTGYITDTNGNITGFMPGCNATSLAAGQCAFHNTWSQLQPASENYNAVSRFTKTLGGDWQASVQATYFESKAEQVGNPSSTFASGYQGITSGPGVTPTLLTALGPTTIPSTNPSYPAGAGGTSGLLTYTFLDLGPTVTKTDARTTRLVADIQGSAAGWDMTAAAGYTQVRLNLKGYNSVNSANLQTALDSTTDPYLVGQTNSQAVDNFIAPVLTTNDSSKLVFFQANGSHDLFALPGGEAEIAVGADYVHRTQDAVAPAEVAAGLINSFSNNYTIGTQNVASVHAELSAPILKTLEADAAVRYDHYNLSGGKASPEAGFKWTPTKAFALRGTAAKGFRAPGPAENGTAGQTFFTGATDDPVLCANDKGNPAAPGNFPSQCAESVGTVQSTTKTLKPETSNSYTLGIVLEPIKDLSATLDFYSIKIKNQIVAGSSQTAIRGTNLTPILQVQPDGSTALVAPPVAPIAYYSVGYVNANSTETSGLDADLTWRHNFEGVAEFKSDFMITWMAAYNETIDGVKYHLAGTHGPLVVGGDTGSPRTRINWANTLSHGPVSVTGTLNYVSGYSLVDPSFGVDDCPTALQYGAGSAAFAGVTGVPAGVSCRVGSFFTFDVESHYDVTKHFTVNASVLNLFNNRAPLDWATYGGGSAPYNPSLHQQGAIGRYMTVGASYTF